MPEFFSANVSIMSYPTSLRSRWSRTSSQEDDTPGRRTGQRSQLTAFSMSRVVVETKPHWTGGSAARNPLRKRRCLAKHENARNHQLVYPVLAQKQTLNVLPAIGSNFEFFQCYSSLKRSLSISISLICRAHCAISCPWLLQR